MFDGVLLKPEAPHGLTGILRFAVLVVLVRIVLGEQLAEGALAVKLRFGLGLDVGFRQSGDVREGGPGAEEGVENLGVLRGVDLAAVRFFRRHDVDARVVGQI